MDNDKKVIRSAFWYTASSFLIKTIAFITTPIFARLMTQAEYGDFSNYLSWTGIVTIVVSLNLDATFVRASVDYKDDFDKYVFSMIALGVMCTMIGFLLCTAFSQYFEQIFSMDLFYIRCMFCTVICQSIVSIFQNAERVRFKYKWTVVVSIYVSIATSLISVLFVMLFEERLKGRIFGNLLPVVIIALAIIFYYFYHAKMIDRSMWKYALPISLPYIPHLLSMLLLGVMDRIMIQRICGAVDNAIYSMAYSCGTLITVLITALNSSFTPWLGQMLQQKKYNNTKKVSKYYVLFMVVFTMLVMIVTPEILYIFGGERYADAKNVMPPVMVSCFFQFLYCMYVGIEQFEKKTIGMALASISATLLNAILNAYFIPKFGYIVAAYTTLASYLWLLIAHMILVKKLNLLKVYNNRVIIISILGMLVYTFIMQILFRFTEIRIMIFVLFIFLVTLILYLKRKKVMPFLKKIFVR